MTQATRRTKSAFEGRNRARTDQLRDNRTYVRRLVLIASAAAAALQFAAHIAG